MRGQQLSFLYGRHIGTLSSQLGIISARSHPARGLCDSRPQHVSKMFQPSYVLPQGTRKEEMSCKSQRLMMENGLIRQSGPGTFHLLPLAHRALEKLIKVIDSEMKLVGGQKIAMPSLASSVHWKESGRWEQMGAELFKLKDRHGTELCLAPTHEEAVTDIIAAEGAQSYKRLPIKLYQITNKYRDEPRPRFGLLRGREFTMKVVGDIGSIGGSLSHEYHLPAETGEDELFHCDRGKQTIVQERLSKSECSMRLKRGIEVGHAFLLGTKYSKVFNAAYIDSTGNRQLTEMGCYGLGVTRILAASIEVLSTEEEIHWPQIIAPYQVYVVPPKRKSREEAAIPLAEKLCNDIIQSFPTLQDELLLDDRDHLTIGRRVTDAKKLGYPYIIIVAKRALEEEPCYEVHSAHQGTTEYLTKSELLQTLASINVV